jgi:hypothetical protein
MSASYDLDLEADRPKTTVLASLDPESYVRFRAVARGTRMATMGAKPPTR